MTKRFIAGAVCPGCRNEDTTYIETTRVSVSPEKVAQTRRCTRCDFSDTLGDDVPESEVVVSEWQPVRLGSEKPE
ncbi:MAG: YheV family putative metal-binding protein [Pseudomonadales bacterium]|nr:YheV family putative metal-binding protein [Pseudomonadales bacterium]